MGPALLFSSLARLVTNPTSQNNPGFDPLFSCHPLAQMTPGEALGEIMQYRLEAQEPQEKAILSRLGNPTAQEGDLAWMSPKSFNKPFPVCEVGCDPYYTASSSSSLWHCHPIAPASRVQSSPS